MFHSVVAVARAFAIKKMFMCMLGAPTLSRLSKGCRYPAVSVRYSRRSRNAIAMSARLVQKQHSCVFGVLDSQVRSAPADG